MPRLVFCEAAECGYHCHIRFADGSRSREFVYRDDVYKFVHNELEVPGKISHDDAIALRKQLFDNSTMCSRYGLLLDLETFQRYFSNEALAKENPCCPAGISLKSAA